MWSSLLRASKDKGSRSRDPSPAPTRQSARDIDPDSASGAGVRERPDSVDRDSRGKRPSVREIIIIVIATSSLLYITFCNDKNAPSSYLVFCFDLFYFRSATWCAFNVDRCGAS